MAKKMTLHSHEADTARLSSRKRTMNVWFKGTLMMSLLGCLVLLMTKHDQGIVSKKQLSRERNTKTATEMDLLLKQGCVEVCKGRTYRGNHESVFNNTSLLRLVEESRARIVDDLKSKYGGAEMFSKIFESSPGVLRETFVSPSSDGESFRRFKRKLQIKVLEVQSKNFQENSETMKRCHCDGRTEAVGSRWRRERQLASIIDPASDASVDHFLSRFVWVTSGHSAAASHGNLHNESYTAFLEHVAKPVFEAIGIAFEGRNYAMGGMKSAPLLALCNEAIYGTDADVLCWDFGMTDNRYFHKKGVFANRAGVHRNRPTIVDMNILGRILPERIEELRLAESYGLTTLYIKEGTDVDMMRGIPDMFGMSQNQIDSVPEFIRYIKCDEAIEKGDPGCTSNKWNPVCPGRNHKTSWHPGWRVHALYGFSIGLFLVDSLVKAIEELGTSGYDPQMKLKELKREEDELYKQFFQSKVKGGQMEEFLNGTITSNIDPQIFYRERVMCHTPILPSESRYKGYFSGTPTMDKTSYEKGIDIEVIDSVKANGKLRISMERKERQEWCPLELKIDFKDFFYANSNDLLVNLTFPNDAEIKEYGPWKPHGVMVICFGFCAWHHCPKGDRSINDLNNGLLEITINEIPVTRLWSISPDDECGVAQNSIGWFFPQNKEGRYDLSARVIPGEEGPLAFTRISALIVL